MKTQKPDKNHEFIYNGEITERFKNQDFFLLNP